MCLSETDSIAEDSEILAFECSAFGKTLMNYCSGNFELGSLVKLSGEPPYCHRNPFEAKNG
jgi:hypothetical protein